jgi:hypothetical protein
MARTLRSLGLLSFLAALSLDSLLSLLMILTFSASMQGQQTDRPTDEQVQKAAEGVVRTAGQGSENVPLKTSRRLDLEEALLSIDQTPRLSDVRFFEMQSARTAIDIDNDATWVVAVTGSTREVYELYGFEPAEELRGSSRDFNRLISQLMPSISNDKAISLARFFLGCCVGEERNEIVLNEDDLKNSVERNYINAYGDVWRALNAYTQWAQLFQAHAPPHLTASVRVTNGGYRVGVKTVSWGERTQPQLLEWDLEISLNGSMRVLGMQPIFPRQADWMFYDFRAVRAPLLIP